MIDYMYFENPLPINALKRPLDLLEWWNPEMWLWNHGSTDRREVWNSCLDLMGFGLIIKWKMKMWNKIDQIPTIVLWNANRCQVSFTMPLFKGSESRKTRFPTPLDNLQCWHWSFEQDRKSSLAGRSKKTITSVSKDLFWSPILFNFCK